MSSQESLIEELEILWNNFSKDAEEDKKIHWAQLFLFKFESLDQQNLSIRTSTFLNTVAFQLTSFMLQLVYGIVCNSLTTTNEEKTSATSSSLNSSVTASITSDDVQVNKKNDRNIIFPHLLDDDFDFSYDNVSLSQLILKTPNDITAILALRKFLTHGLGGNILHFLQNCDIKFLTSRKIFSTLLINLFPNTSWENSITNKNLKHFYENHSLKTILNKFIDEFNLLEVPLIVNTTNRCNKDFLNTEITTNSNNEPPITMLNQRDFYSPSVYDDDLNNYEIKSINYDQEKFTNFLGDNKTSDQIAYLLLNLLTIITKDEYGINLDDNSITINCFKFSLELLSEGGIDCITKNCENRDILKLKCLSLLEITLNNIFIKRNNYDFLEFNLVFNKLFKCLMWNVENQNVINKHVISTESIHRSIPINSDQNIEFNIIIILEIIFLQFSLLNNLLIITKLDSFIDILKSIESDKFNCFINILNNLLLNININEEEVCKNFFKKFLDINFKIISNLKIMSLSNKNLINNKNKFIINHRMKQCSPYNMSTSKHRKSYNKKLMNTCTKQKQMHCKENFLPCLFEKNLLNIFKNLPTTLELQENLLKYFFKNGLCCCLYNFDIINTLLLNQYELKIQKLIYKFLSNRLLKTRNMRNHCLLCDQKFKSYNFYETLFQIYNKKFEMVESKVGELLIFLKHLLKLSNLFSYEIVSKILIDIALPVFRSKKIILINNNDCVKKIEDTAVKSNDKNLTSKNNKTHHSKPNYLTEVNIILECLNIFTVYLNDVRLIKSFFNTENLKHIKELLYFPELIKSLSDLIKIGLDNSTFLGYNLEEQQMLEQELIKIQLESANNSTSYLITILNNDQTKFNFNLLCQNYVENLKFKSEQFEKLIHKKLNFTQILYLISINWSSTLDLYKTNKKYHIYFHDEYPSLNEGNNNENMNNILFQIIYNVLSAYLYYYHGCEENILENPTNIDNKSEVYSMCTGICSTKNIMDLNNMSTLFSFTYEKEKTISDYFEKDVNIYSSNDNFVQQPIIPVNKFLNQYKEHLPLLQNCDKYFEQKINNLEYITRTRHIETYFNNFKSQLFNLENFNDCENDLLLLRLESYTFLDTLISEQHNYKLLFDIKRTSHSQKKKIPSSVEKFLSSGNNDKNSNESLLSTIYDFTVNVLKNTLPFNFDNFFNQNEQNKEDSSPDNIGEEIILNDGNSYLWESGNGKLHLLKIFEYTLNIFILDNSHLRESIMQKQLNLLRNLILSNSEKFWDHIENANLIIQALQSLLKIGEMVNRNSNNSDSAITKSFQIQLGNDSKTNETQPEELISVVQQHPTSSIEDFQSSKFSCSQHDDSEIEFSEENDTDEFYVTADEGYEADAEIQDNSENSVIGTAWNSFIPSSRYRTQVIHEGICHIIVDILIKLSEKCVKKPNFWANNLSQLANRLFVIRDSLGGPLFLLKGFTPILKCNDTRLKDFQQTILDLITEINTPDVLSAYLAIMASENPPIEILMKYMAYICLSSVSTQPKAELKFPIQCDNSIHSTCNILIFEQIEKLRNYHEFHGVESPFTSSACILPITHTKIWAKNGFTLSTWLQIKTSNGMQSASNVSNSKAQSDEFNVVNKTPTHIISFGTNQILLSIYVNNDLHLMFETYKPNAEFNAEDIFENESSTTNSNERKRCKSGCILKRTKKNIKNYTNGQLSGNKENLPPKDSEISDSRGINVDKRALKNVFQNTKKGFLNKFNLFQQQSSESVFECSSAELKYFRLAPKKWTHLCFSVDIHMDQFQITTTVDGAEQYLLSLPCNNLQSFVKMESFQVACFGQIIHNSIGSLNSIHTSTAFSQSTIEYGLSNLLIFDQSFKGKSLLGNLTALGPDATNLSLTLVGNSVPNYSLINFNKIYKFNIDNFQESMKLLKNNLIASYSAFEPTTYKGFDIQTNNGFNYGAITFGKSLNTNKIASIQTAVILCGGLSPLLFLFGRIVELSTDSNVQALALDLLLHVALADISLYTEFVKKDYLNLLHFVIRTDHCAKNIDLLTVIVNNSCNEAILIKKNDKIKLNENTTACLLHPQILISVIKRYCDWCRSGTKNSKILDTILKCIQILIRDKHKHQEFNIQQLNSVNLIRELLNLCKIYIIESPNPVFLSVQGAELYVQILSSFAGSPPNISILDEIMKLLLLLQRPSDCYVTHDRGKFYFLITPQKPVRHKKISLPLPSRQLRHLMRERKKSTPIPKIGQAQERSSYRKSISRERQTSSEKVPPPSFSRLSMEKQITNFSNVLFQDFNSLETIANCSRINSMTGIRVLHSPGKMLISNSIASRKKRHNSYQENKSRIQKVSKRAIRSAKSAADLLQNNTMSRGSSSNSKGSDLSLSDFNFRTNKCLRNDINSVNESQNIKYKIEKFEFYKSPGIFKLQEHLYNLLRDFVLILPDTSVSEVLTHYVKMEILIVLANHTNPFVRASIIRLIGAVCTRTQSTELQMFNKKLYFHHLGNQISIHPADHHLLESCAQWLTGTFLKIDDILLNNNAKVVNQYSVQSFLSILLQLFNNTEVLANAFVFLKYLYEKDPESNALLLENGIVQVAIKVLNKIFITLKSTIDSKVEENIIMLLITIAQKSLKSHGQITVLWDTVNLLSYYQAHDIINVVKGFQYVQAKLLTNLLNQFTTNVPLNPNLNPKVSSPTLPNVNLSLNEIRTRYDLLIDRIIQFFFTLNSTLPPTQTEIELFEQIVKICITSTNQRHNNFLAWGLLPNRQLDQKVFIVNNLYSFYKDRAKNFSIIYGDIKTLSTLLWLFLNEIKENTKNKYENLIELCKHLNINSKDVYNAETELDKMEISKENLIAKQRPIIEKVVYKYEPIINNLIDTSMEITRIVAELQNAERKILMSQMKENDESYVFQKWLAIIQNMTHEGAPWFSEDYYSKSWELDDTEGPARQRSRLKRCSLDLDRRFLMKEYHDTNEIKIKSHPLNYLVTSGDQQINISLNSQILYNFPATYLPVDSEINGELIITDLKIYFLARFESKLFYRSCDILKITEIWVKRYQHQENAFEIFLESGRSLFYALQNNEDYVIMKELFHEKIIQIPEQFKLLQITQEWKDGLLTNWEYLMTLNQISGRTYNDLMQFPVFPWIISNYTSSQLDLTDPSNFRKLDKPIAVQYENNENHFINHYAYLNNNPANIGTIQLKPYHYSSHYSNSGTVLHFLVRVPPFTNFFLRYQDNNFDLPDRTFHCLKTTWSLASRDSATDVKELIPEFFCLPEIFENFEKLNFGNRQSGEIVSNVKLPPWCSNDARLFVLIHRQALESEYVRNNLHHWIDLIFGYKQTGQAAVEALNVFHPATYPEFLTTKITDPIERMAVDDMIKTYGQMPKQLLKFPHPASKILNYSLGKTNPIPTVKGIRWGAFTGSPQLPEPKLTNIHKLKGISQLIAFRNTNVIYGLPTKCCVMQSAEPDVYNLISWGEHDHLIKIQPLSTNLNYSQCKILIYNDIFDEISSCGCEPNSNALWFGHKSGRISVYQCHIFKEHKSVKKTSNIGMKLSYNSAFRKFSIKSNFPKQDDCNFKEVDGSSSKSTFDQMSWSGPLILIRHTDEVTSIAISCEFKIVVTSGKDGLAVIWDLNSFNYVRTIERPSEIHHSPITLIAISPSLGDILTIHSIEKSNNEIVLRKNNEDCFEATEENLDGFININIDLNGKSIIRLHSVNAKYINHLVHEEKILSVCYSHLKEGVGVNVIAAGFEGGVIRFWSSWNLELIKQINIGGLEVCSLTFSTYQYLVALTRDGFIQVWESEGLLGNTPKFPQIIFNNK